MAKVRVVTDSTCDLEKNILLHLDVDSIPLYITFGNSVYKDGVDLNTNDMYQLVKKNKMLPKTSCRSIEEFRRFFQKQLDEGYEQVFYIGIGSKLSATFNNARLAAEEVGNDKVVVADSANLSTGIGLLVYKACKFRDQGMNAQEIGKEIEKIVPKVRSQFVVDTLEYLHKGGRCSGMTRVMGTLLMIKPNIKVVNGSLIVARKARGMKQGLKMMIEDIRNDFLNEVVDLDHVMITHTCADKEAAYIKQKLIEEVGIDEKAIVETNAGCVISSHCGEGTIGILYIVK